MTRDEIIADLETCGARLAADPLRKEPPARVAGLLLEDHSTHPDPAISSRAREILARIVEGTEP
jgi:hypothetical protein